MALSIASEKQLKVEKKFFYDMLVKDYPDSKVTKRAKISYSDTKQMEIGKQIPDFKVVSLDNPLDTISPKSLKGKYVLIDIWTTWCGPCVGEMGSLHKAYEKFKDKNFTMLSVSIDNKIDLPKKFRNGKWKMPWLNGFGEGAWDSDIAISFETTGIPRPVLIDPNGKIIAMEEELRGAKLDKTLEKELKTNFIDTPLEVPLEKKE